jgi:O-antigen ligase
MIDLSVRRRIGTLILFLGPITTFAVSPFYNFDPINLAKLLFVTSFAFAMLALLVSGGIHRVWRSERALLIASVGFVFWMLVSMYMSDAPINQQIWGVFGRNTGMLTYTSLMIVLLATTLLFNVSVYHKLVDALVLTSIPMTLYALVQVAGRDPISWSQMAPFATLGNINFSSAFFGLAAVCAVILGMDKKNSILLRAGLLLLALIQMLVVLETGSIQGFMIFIAGLGIGIFLWIRTAPRLRILQLPYLALGLVAVGMVVIALFNQGPLARFVFQNTILFRFDYWYAGWMMTLRHPIFGVGLDSYGDWYRELRGEVATLRTGPDRITNTAHNIYLDISASGGFPLLLFYAFILALALVASLRLIRRQKVFNPYLTALFSAWIAFLIQAGVSINQVGVGIWGWLFTGALIGYEKASRSETSKQPEKSVGRKPQAQLPALAALSGILGFGVGFVLAFIPLNADAKFKNSLQSGVVRDQFVAAQALGTTAYHLELSLDSAIKAGDELLSKEVSDELLERYPRDFMAWRVRQVLTSSTPEQREDAYRRLRELDPFNTTTVRIP